MLSSKNNISNIFRYTPLKKADAIDGAKWSNAVCEITRNIGECSHPSIMQAKPDFKNWISQNSFEKSFWERIHDSLAMSENLNVFVWPSSEVNARMK